jgi:hypothetical protein
MDNDFPIQLLVPTAALQITHFDAIIGSGGFPMNDMPSAVSTRTLLMGFGLGALAILLFVGLWVLLGGIEPLPRMFIAVCLPPALMALGVGLYMLLRKR